MAYPDLTSAHHEAAHAVIGIQLGGRITQLSLLESDRAKDQFCITFEHTYQNEPAKRWLLANAITLFAGYEGDKKNGFDGDFIDAGAEDDYTKAAELLRQCVTSDSQYESFRAKVMESTVNLVDKHWNRIDALAKELSSKGHLPGYKVIALLENVRKANETLEPAL